MPLSSIKYYCAIESFEEIVGTVVNLLRRARRDILNRYVKHTALENLPALETSCR